LKRNTGARAGWARKAAEEPARTRFGQHFLEPAWVDRVIHAIEPAASDVFLEIGPGHGALTRPLAARAARVVACEIDAALVAELRRDLPPNLDIIGADFLLLGADRVRAEVSSDSPPPGRLRVAGNLPYNVASPILRKLVELYGAGLPFVDATVMLQREVADRVTASPGSRDYGVLTIRIRRLADATPLLALPPGAFRPPPKVHSTVVRLIFHPPDPRPTNPGTFDALTEAIFTRRRKTLLNALRAYQHAPLEPHELLYRAGIDGGRRPETLEIPELVRLADLLDRS
jgi:16S rRNA (adenine1518-N6/adenine1519-N6)-dimethyltransferase